MVMTSAAMQLHPLFAFAGLNAAAAANTGSSGSSTPSSSTSSNSSTTNNLLPSGLSITVSSQNGSNNNNHSSSSPPNVNKMEIDSQESEPSSPMSSGPPSPAIPISSAAAASQQHALRALANGLQASLQSVALNNSQSNSNAAAALNQASLLAAATKLMEMNNTNSSSGPTAQSQQPSVDDIVMQEVTSRLVKMNQELWQQAGINPAALMNNNKSTNSTNEGNHQKSSSSNAQQLDELKLAEKIVNDLALQQQQQSSSSSSSSRNGPGFHLNERTLQECWTTLQRVSCMIFMHKSAMQLQQQQQQQVGPGSGGSGGPNQLTGLPIGSGSGNISGSGGGGHIRAGSISSAGSESGISKPHQCNQCLKAFSSNHQLVQHVRVHTGEKPYKCSYCDRRFKQLSHVQQHTRLHTGERPYKCHVHDCGRAFIQLSNLQQHLRNHDAQLERSKNRPFHCSICGKGFATESSLRTHTAKVCKEHASLIGGPNAVTCPICHKLFLGGEALMEHMKHTHKDPNASGVATKRRTANHPCPICGKHYVNEGSLRKHLTCHPETANLGSSLRMWPCSVCQAVFNHETGLLTHMEQMRMDPKHSFAAQYVLSRAAAERRERENILSSASAAAMAMAQGGNPFGLGALLPMPPSPSGSDSSDRLSGPLEGNNSSSLNHGRMSPLDARVGSNNHNNNNSPNSNGMDNNKYNGHHGENNNISSLLSGMGNGDNGPVALGKMAAMLGQGHMSGSHHHGHGYGQNGQPNSNGGQQGMHGQADMMSTHRLQAEAILRSQAEALQRLANNNNSNNNNSNGNVNNLVESIGNQLNLSQHNGGGVGNSLSNGSGQNNSSGQGGGNLHGHHHHHHNSHYPSSLNQQQLNSILSQNSDLSEALLRLDARGLGFPLSAHGS